MSSRRGKLRHLIRATLDFAATRWFSIPSSLCVSRRYTTAPYAFPEASAKPCNSSLVMSSTETWTTARFTAILERSGNFSFQVCRWPLSSDGSGSSHAIPSCHSSWIITFALTVYGARHPNGSKTEAANVSKPLFVSGISATTLSSGQKVSTSAPLSQRIARVFHSRLPSLDS
ncbi:hypothetical protein T11_9958 [Trichinella zimbabwensis]|uniref:Uncharacterized protein n=1 Tax=Trichinella zimbabwensis TaxID=268475 RepID=A0A0V1I2Z0_9BILA|nr:hypothetical protein T11_9958 [Trichinella zimbabwensis]